MNRRIPTTEDKKRARRLKRIWNERKRALDLTQVSAAKKLGITQPSLSQYLNAIIPLNTDITFKFAELLEVPATEINPELANVSSLMAFKNVNPDTIRVPLIGSIAGKSVMGRTGILAEGLLHETNYAGISVDNESLENQGIPKGSTLLLNLDEDPCQNKRMVAARVRGYDGYRYLQYISETPSGYMMHDPAYGKQKVYRKADILGMFLVQSVQMP